MKLDNLIWAEHWKKGLVFVFCIILLVLFIPYVGGITNYLFYLRVPVIFGAILLAFPLLSVTVLASMFRNLFVQAYWQQVALILISVMFAATAVILTFDSILQNAATRFSLQAESIAIPFAVKVLCALILSASNVWALHKYSKNCDKALVGIGVGAVTGIVLMLLMLTMYEAQLFLQWIEAFVLMLVENQAGYVGADDRLLSTHANLVVFSVLGFIIYCPFGVLFKPWKRAKQIQIPAILYLNMIMTFSCLVFAGLTFYFDLYHIPVFFGFLVVSAFSYKFFNVDHYYEITPHTNQSAASVPADFASILNKRLAHQQAGKSMVVVCCSGGGIQAGAWAAQVLTGLQKEAELGASFCRAISLVSSVSGGSVGSLFYLDQYDKGTLPLNQQPLEQDPVAQAVFNGATTDVLNAVGWGLAYPDLMRFFGLPWLPPKMMDRGTVIEEDWKSSLHSDDPDKAPTFSNWRHKITQGLLPIPLFNATLVESGKRFIISPVSFFHADNRECEDFSSAYSGFDVSAVSAARLSATFPYVSPVSKNISFKNVPDYHVADGGFFDNYGVFSSLEWIKNHVQPLKKAKQLDVENILFIEIHAFAEAEDTSPKDISGWKTALAGPIAVLLNARGATQVARNNMEVEVVKGELEEDGINLQQVVITFPSMPSPYDANKDYIPPLSWKLSEQEKQVVKNAWKKVQALPDENNPIKEIKHLWTKWNAK